MSFLKRFWCWLTCHSWKLYFLVNGTQVQQEAFRLECREIACGRCGDRIPARIERRGDVLLSVPAYWPDSKIVPDWMIESLR